MTLTPGTRLGPYEILAPLGAGGMGEVYRAHDPRLRREVALKILPAAVAQDPERLKRFEREARAVAALSHPNLVVVHDVGVGDPPYIVMELVAGGPLRERLRQGPFQPERAAAIAAQIAGALAAAHARGIVHRDLKPENVVLDRQDHAKVLDFGLARLATAPAASAEAQAAPTLSQATEAGILMGTPGYMAPEQVRGEAADATAAIFALGLILYEMLTAEPAFAGESAVDVLHATLRAEPRWERVPATAASLLPILRRCLEKLPEARFQSAADLAWALDRPASSPRPSSSPRPALPALLGAAFAGALLAAAFAGWWITRRPQPAAAPSIERMTRLVSTPAHEFGPVLSPDGKWVAYLSNARGPTDIWVKFIAGGDPVNLTAAVPELNVQSQDYIGGLAVSPDGSQIAFQANRGGDRGGGTWVIPAPVGGPPRLLLPSPAMGMQWSPDGKRVAYVKAGGPLGDALAVADPDGQNEIEIVKRHAARHLHWLRWDTAGRYVYFNYGYQNANAEPTEVFRQPVAGGPIESVITTTRRAVSAFPSPDGRGLIYAGNPDGADLELRWRELAGSRDARVTTGVGDYSSPAMSADGRRLVGTVQDVHESLERVAVAFDRAVQFEPLTDGFSGDLDATWSPDGTRLVFSSSRAGNRTLWSARVEAGRLTRIAPLTSGTALDARPVFSPDGRQIAFVSDRSGRRGIWLVSAEAGTPRKLADADVIDTVSWSPDGRRLVFSTPVGDAPGLMVIDAATGATVRIPTPAAAAMPDWSPKEDLIAFLEPRGQGRGTFMKFVRSTGETVAYRGGLPETTSFSNGQLAWSRDGTRLAVEQQSGAFHGALWIVEPGAPEPYRKLIDLPDGVRLRGIAWDREGTSLVLGRIQRTSDVFLAELAAPK
jgi:Tol biopolymer transport system component